MHWQPIETAPENETCLFWLISKPPEECFCNTSGQPIFSTEPPRVSMTRKWCWSSLEKATHWMPLPAAPNVDSKRQACDCGLSSCGECYSHKKCATSPVRSIPLPGNPYSTYQVPLSSLGKPFSPEELAQLVNPTAKGTLTSDPVPEHFYLHAYDIIRPGDERKNFWGWKKVPPSWVGTQVGVEWKMRRRTGL